MSVATSGDYRQYAGSYGTSHIVGSKDFVSATVACDSLMDADAAASCVFLLGSEGAGGFLKRHGDFKAYAIDQNLGEHTYNGFERLQLSEAIANG